MEVFYDLIRRTKGAGKNIKSKRAKVTLGLLLVLIVTLIALTANTVYGVIYKHDVIVDALYFEYPAGGTLSEYSYFAGRFRAVLVYDDPQAYESVMDSLYGPGVNYVVQSVSEERIESTNPSLLEDSSFVEAVQFYDDLPPCNVCGVAIKTERQTILYVSRPIPRRAVIAEQII